MTSPQTQFPSTANQEQNQEQQFFVFWRNEEGGTERGPLHVLWQMIESYQIDIFDISLERLTEDFLDFLEERKKLRIDIAASFMHMAARLIYYKSKALLPTSEFMEQEEENRLPKELVQQLLEYRKYQTAAGKLRAIEEVSSGMQSREAKLELENTQSEIQQEEIQLDLNLTDLIVLYARLLKRTDGNKKENLIYDLEEYSVEDQIDYLNGLLEKLDSFRFEEIFENPDFKQIKIGELVAVFLALLELTLQGKIIIRQKCAFGEIRIQKRNKPA